MEHPRHQPLNSRAREVRRVASDSDTLVAPEQAQTASVDSHNDAQLMSFFREIVAKKAGTILFKDCLLKAHVPLGAQTLAQVYQGWARSMKRLKKTKEIAVTKDDPNVMSTWKVDVLA